MEMPNSHRLSRNRRQVPLPFGPLQNQPHFCLRGLVWNDPKSIQRNCLGACWEGSLQNIKSNIGTQKLRTLTWLIYATYLLTYSVRVWQTDGQKMTSARYTLCESRVRTRRSPVDLNCAIIVITSDWCQHLYLSAHTYTSGWQSWWLTHHLKPFLRETSLIYQRKCRV